MRKIDIWMIAPIDHGKPTDFQNPEVLDLLVKWALSDTREKAFKIESWLSNK